MSLPDRAHISTEQRNPRSMGLDAMSVEECVALINAEDATVAAAVGRAAPQIAAFIADVERAVRGGGRLIYLGAGTSGRLGVLDASECPPTFQAPEGMIVGIIAGGDGALRKSSEGKEDDRDGAAPEFARLSLTSRDVVLGIAAGATTPYVLGALERAHAAGCVTGLLTCADIAPAQAPHARHIIKVLTGPEVLTGSTRMKAGTATKMVLNTITTTLFVRLGKCYENLMVDLRASNGKLLDRAARILSTLTGLPRDDALALLSRPPEQGGAGGNLKIAIVMQRKRLSHEQATAALARHAGALRTTLET